jgi:hypothetical protein
MNVQSKYRGEVTLFNLDRKNNTFTYAKAHNDIQPDARGIVLKTLAGLKGPIDTIIVSCEGVDVYRPIYQVQYPNTRSVIFLALFAEDDPVGVIDALSLVHSSIGPFSWFNTLSVIKPATIQLLVRWKIELDSCEGLEPEPTFGNGLIYQNGAGIILQDDSGLLLNLPE